MTGTGPHDHDRHDELAAGYALHALDPADQREFLAHLPRCPRCQAAVTDYTEVTAGLADTWAPGEPSPQLRERIMAAIAQHPAPAASQPRRDNGPAAPPPATVTSLADRRRRRQAIVAAAAAAVLAAGAIAWGVLPGSGGGPHAPAAGCAHAGTCREVELTSTRSRDPAARVIITGGTAWLIPSGLPPDDSARQVYVLWQITATRTPRAVGTFDVTGHPAGPVRIGPLAIPYHATRAFAVSLEHGRAIPPAPASPVALGHIRS